nr:DUF1287 domain-containing protein [uncultured Moellerella sp.]
MKWIKTGLLLMLTFLLPFSAIASLINLSEAAKQLNSRVIYDSAYEKIPYPNGDVAPNKGVCTDVVIRSYRQLGIDLQQLVHEDMKANFTAYPSKKLWGLTRTDTNIDHRRVPNLAQFFSRKGQTKKITPNAADYIAGDLVTWQLDNGRPHIGIVIDKKSAQGVPLVVHNIGYGQISENILFSWKITGHYRYAQ